MNFLIISNKKITESHFFFLLHAFFIYLVLRRKLNKKKNNNYLQHFIPALFSVYFFSSFHVARNFTATLLFFSSFHSYVLIIVLCSFDQLSLICCFLFLSSSSLSTMRRKLKLYTVSSCLSHTYILILIKIKMRETS